MFHRLEAFQSEPPGFTELAPLMLRPVDELELTVRTLHILKSDNIYFVGDLIQRTEADLLETPQLGRKVLGEIKEVLASHWLTLSSHIETRPPHSAATR